MAVGVLGLLAMLAVAFVTMAQLERRASMQRLYATKASLLARSGLEDALARLSAGQDASRLDTQYRGEDFDGNGILDTGVETSEQLFNPAALDTDECPLRQALRPSFFVDDPAGMGASPALLQVEGRWRGYSGRLAGDFSVYALKIEDESGKINVNGGFLDALNRDAASGDTIPDHRDPDVRVNPADPKDTGLGWNFQLMRILGNLGAQPEVGIPTMGTDVLGNRPAGGYASIAQLQIVLGTTRDLSPYLTTVNWSDTKVIHPNGYPGQLRQSSLPSVKENRAALCLEEEGRSPVNLNAAPRPVLVALLQDLQGSCWGEPLSPVTYTLTQTTVSNVATALESARPFATWGGFSAFLDVLVTSSAISGYVGSAGNLCAADLIKANFDPNTQLMKQNSDQLMWRWIDKSDLIVWSTEGSLGPTGLFRIAATGRILGTDDHLLAERTLSCQVEAFSLLRQTSQEDFVSGRPLEGYLSRSTDGLLRTTGASASWPGWGGGTGLAAMTYPSSPTALPIQAAVFDGSIGLATYDLPSTSPPGVSLKFLHHFDDSWDAEPVSVFPARVPHPGNASLQTSVSGSPWPDPALSDPERRPSTLCPDGVHEQHRRGPAFQATGNFPVSYTSGEFPSNHGVLSYWAKDCLTSRNINIQFSCIRFSVPLFQTLLIGMKSGETTWGIQMKSTPVDLELGGERQWHVTHGLPGTSPLPGQKWHLVTAMFDSDEQATGSLATDTRMMVWGMAGVGDPDENAGYPDRFVEQNRRDLLEPGLPFVLGSHGNYLSNAVIDEFAILDFGDGGAAAESLLSPWHADRYRDGRYYRKNDARFLSSLLDPSTGQPARLLSAVWTAYLPRESRKEVDRSGSPSGYPRVLDPILAESSLGLELLDASGTLTSTPLRSLIPGAVIGLILPGFRYRVTFRPDPVDPATGLSDPDNQPVLESPWFDDITFAWQHMTGPKVLSWERP
jgi:hypothetical protein